MDETNFTVLDLINLDLKEHNSLNLKCIGGRKGLIRKISTPYINRPGLALAGFFDSFGHKRLQIFGQGEASYLQKLEKDNSIDAIKLLFSYSMPCCIFTHNLFPSPSFTEISEAAQCPILQTSLSTSEFSARITRILSEVFAPQQSIHGVLVEVYGLGVLILGDSGVGKSETALELVTNGHRLVADDVVDLRCVNGNILMGMGSNKIIAHHMEIRGMGIINVNQLFGVRAIRDKKEVQLVVHLGEWDSRKNYDRIGIEEQYDDFLGVKVPKLEIPVKPGRNIPIIIQTAAMNERLKKMGHHSAREFNHNILKWLESDAIKPVYFGSEDII